MPIFSLTDIKFNAPKGPTGPLGSLGPNSSKFSHKTYRYPSDLGSSDKNHWLKINILEQRKTSYINEGSGELGTSTSDNNAKAYGSMGGNASVNKIAGMANDLMKTKVGGSITDILTGGASSITGFVSKAAGSLLGTNKATVQEVANGIQVGTENIIKNTIKELENASVRATTRIAETICLYMPDTMQFDYSQHYNKADAGGSNLMAAAMAGKSLQDTANNPGLNNSAKGQSAVQNMSPFIQNAAFKSLGGFGQIAFQASTGLVENPMMEMLYGSPEFRTFQFDFNFYPRSTNEAKQVLNIIRCLRFHQAPELNPESGNFFLVPPSEFDISFYYNDQQNYNIPQISTCILESINTNYAPGGWAAYEVPSIGVTKGGTGMPVAINLSLRFKETEIMTKQAFNNQDSIDDSDNSRVTKSSVKK
jgi:hypothetical protein